MEKIDAVEEGIKFACLKCLGYSKPRTILHSLCGILAMTRTNDQKYGKILN
jgi:hypothetical protein